MIVGNDLVGNGVVPTSFYEQDRSSVFTSPDTTKNRLTQFQLAGNYFVNDNFTITGQFYRRNSKRKQKNADVYTDYANQAVSQNFPEGTQYTCQFRSTNQYGIPDYVVIDIPDPNDFSFSPFLNDFFNSGVPKFDLLGPDTNGDGVSDAFNRELPKYFADIAKGNLDYNANPTQYIYTNQFGPTEFSGEETDYSNLEASYSIRTNQFQNDFAVSSLASQGVDFEIFQALATSYYYTEDGAKHVVAFRQAINGEACLNDQTNSNSNVGLAYNLLLDPVTNKPRTVDALYDGGEGYVEGIPTAVITDNRINQIVDGASVQFNWNLEHHKFMVGASIDNAYAEYKNSQQLGFFDAKRDGKIDPNRALDIYAAADRSFSNNNFDGNSRTKSLYLSETWSPVETFHMTGAVRYNETQVNSSLSARDFGQSEISLSDILNTPNLYEICPNGVCSGQLGYRPTPFSLRSDPETEKFSYYSLNPSLGATWQAKENLNVYANWAQGTRTPSVVELGCALDKTPTQFGLDQSGNPVFFPAKVVNGRSCQLPSGLSGDPYLPQVKAETFDLGMRGRWADAIEWNFGYYRTELKDDIYIVTYFDNQNFFESIGKTRRQGIEMGMNGDIGKARFSLNYALTDAKFRS